VTRRRFVPVIGVLAALAFPTAASAVTITPTRFDDPVGGTCNPGVSCSLRQAADFDTPGQPKVILLNAGTYELSQGALDVFQNGDGSTSFLIQGAGARATTIDGNGSGQVLHIVEGSDAVINDITATGGNAGTGSGGGIGIDGAAKLTLSRSTVSGNRAEYGAGIEVGGTLIASASTVSGNVTNAAASTPSPQAGGGGLYVTGQASLTNLTISGNVAHDAIFIALGGGLYVNNGDVQAQNVTIAGNTGDSGGGIWTGGTGASVNLVSTIVSGNSPAACVGVFSGDHNMGADDCGLQSTSDPLLGPLINNGGPTDTRALSVTSPAINAGAGCPATDQRGLSRIGVCDIGAFEYRPPALTVIKRVINNDGNTQTASDFNVHVRAGSSDVAGSPQPGSATGTTYSGLTPGTYSVAEDKDTTYTTSFSGDCSATGTVTLAEGQTATCTITNNDKQPRIRKNVNLEPEGGTVRIKRPGSKKFKVLKEGEQVPVGTIVDTRNGRVTLISAASKTKTATAQFFDGLFKIGQTKGKKPTTVLTLTEKLTGCKATGKAAIAKKKTKKRRLWGDGKGHFRTEGKHSAATVVGTKWLVEDRCTSTLTKVARGKVKVRDFVKKKTVFVKKGHRYIARAK
jgi:hypothetical protein